MSAVEPFRVWTIYSHPSDFPDDYVAREFSIQAGAGPQPTDNVMISASLDLLRRTLMVDMRLTVIPRSDGDEPQIVESWV
jgi:hypothetical protein